MKKTVIISGSNIIAGCMEKKIVHSHESRLCQTISNPTGDELQMIATENIDTVIYFPGFQTVNGMRPDLAESKTVFSACSCASITRFVLISSSAIYGASPANPGLMRESRKIFNKDKTSVQGNWLELEKHAEEYSIANQSVKFTILRSAPVLVRNGDDFFSRLLSGQFAFTLSLRDPSIQLLCLDDLAEAVFRVLKKNASGIFNVAPNGVVPMNTAINMAGMSRVPAPGFIHDIFRKYFFVKKASGQQAQLDYKRYSWTVSNEKITRELGFKPRWSSAETLMAYMGKKEETDIKTLSKFDDYGMDRKYISNWWRLIFKYMHRYYWRIEVKGVENVPRSGKAVLVGIHRGLMPFDGIMHMYIILRETGRNIRFLIHPALVKNPIPISFPKLGCMIANRENADYVLKQDKLLGLYPEGIRGAFKYYQDVYSFGKFGRDEYVKSALRNQAPIIPFITLGSAEIFPIIAKFQWLWWQRLMLWPCFPIAPPFPILPVPLPTKWHTRFLEPFHVENEYPPEAASDPEIVKKIGNQIKNRMYEVLLEMRLRRKSIFWGSIFNNTI